MRSYTAAQRLSMFFADGWALDDRVSDANRNVLHVLNLDIVYPSQERSSLLDR